MTDLTLEQRIANTEAAIEIRERQIRQERDSYNRDTLRMGLEGWKRQLEEMQKELLQSSD